MMSQPPGTNVAVVAVNKSAHATVDETLLMFLRWAKKKLMTILKSSSKKCGGGAGVTIAGYDPPAKGGSIRLKIWTQIWNSNGAGGNWKNESFFFHARIILV